MECSPTKDVTTFSLLMNDPKNASTGLGKEAGLKDGPNEAGRSGPAGDSNSGPAGVDLNGGPTGGFGLVTKEIGDYTQNMSNEEVSRAVGHGPNFSWASLFGSSSGKFMIYTPLITVGDKIVVIPTVEVIEQGVRV